MERTAVVLWRCCVVVFPKRRRTVTAKRSSWVYVRYLLAFLLTPIAVIFALVPFSASDWFLQHHYPGLRNFGYSERIGAAHCEVILYGDSSALTGLDPTIVERLTGLKTCNLSEGSTVQVVAGSDLPLNLYLRRNPPPRFLLGMWSYTSYRPYLQPFTAYQPEGILYVWRYGSRFRLLRAFVRHPDWALTFAASVFDTLARPAAGVAPERPYHRADAQAQRDAGLGMWPFPLPPQAACVRNGLNEGPERIQRWSESVAAFRRRYSTPQTTVLLDISPIPVCNKLAAAYAERTQGLHDNPLEKVGISDFNEGDVHFSPQGSRYVSEQAAHQIVASIHPNGTPEPIP